MEKITLEHALMAEEKAKRFLRGHVVRLGGRVMDPKAQVVAQFVQSIRVPGYFPPIKELRQQLAQAVQLLDEPPVQVARKEDIQIPAKTGNLIGRVYVPKLHSSELLPVLLYYHGGGGGQEPLLETHLHSRRGPG